MTPAVKYTLGRLGIFVAVFAAMLPVSFVQSVLVKAMVALLISAVLSFFVLRTWRDQTAEQLAGAVEKRRAEKERLRAALAGEDEPTKG
jgi:threonine/homoserine/homoserine lactone efflux protein